MTWVVPYLVAVRLIWGQPEVGAPAYCPGQKLQRFDDCERSRCRAWCEVDAIDVSTYTVRLKLVR